MIEYIGPLFTGLVVGAVFALGNMPVPAPPKLAGVLGIFGIFLGFKATEVLI